MDWSCGARRAHGVCVNESTVRCRFEVLRRRGCVSVVTLVPAPGLGFEPEIIFNVTVKPAGSAKECVMRGSASFHRQRVQARLIFQTPSNPFAGGR
jgi:hypothetical protein